MSDRLFRSPLVSTAWLAAHRDTPQLRVFDCTGITGTDYINRGYEQHYAQHHIAGAAYLDMADPRGPMTDPQAPIPYTWPRPEQFAATMQAIGVGNDTPVVLYAAANPQVPGSGLSWATRAWWLMHHYGIDCAVLDGGWQKWIAEGHPVSHEPTAYPPARFAISAGWQRGLALKTQVCAAITDSATVIIDSLSPESYRGEVDRHYGSFGARKGHIPGAVNVHFASLIGDDGCLLDDDALRQRFAAQGVREDRAVIAYCGGGIGATVVGLALKRIGHPRVAVYDGSLMEWANDPELPMRDLSVAG